MSVIYLPIDIKAREFEAKTLLASELVRLGHQALIGPRKQLVDALASGALPRGVYYEKSVTKGDADRIRRLRQLGHICVAQDEEHGLLEERYDRFARMRFGAGSLDDVAIYFGWGAHDSTYLRERFPESGSRIIPTGSPRVDLWRLDSGVAYARPNAAPDGPYVLIASNICGVMAHGQIDESISEKRAALANYRLLDVAEDLDDMAQGLQMVGHLVKLVLHLHEHGGGNKVVLRPHPSESVAKWKALIEPEVDGVVIREGAISSWIAHAKVLIHNGCTSGFEAAVMGVPSIAYTPIRTMKSNAFKSNELGSRAMTPSSCLELIRGRQPAGRHMLPAWLDERFANLSGAFAFRTQASIIDGLCRTHALVDGVTWANLARLIPRSGTRFAIGAALGAMSHRVESRRRQRLRYGKFDSEPMSQFALRLDRVASLVPGARDQRVLRLGDRHFLLSPARS